MNLVQSDIVLYFLLYVSYLPYYVKHEHWILSKRKWNKWSLRLSRCCRRVGVSSIPIAGIAFFLHYAYWKLRNLLYKYKIPLRVIEHNVNQKKAKSTAEPGMIILFSLDGAFPVTFWNKCLIFLRISIRTFSILTWDFQTVCLKNQINHDLSSFFSYLNNNYVNTYLLMCRTLKRYFEIYNIHFIAIISILENMSLCLFSLFKKM